jgi:hypothetical protein
MGVKSLMPFFGLCDVDGVRCYYHGAICRLNKMAGFQTEWSVYSAKKVALRNRSCSHFCRFGSFSRLSRRGR